MLHRPAPATIPHCLYATICPNCAYSLVGLPETGRCPECGRLCDQAEIVLYGYARGRRESLANVKASRLIWLLVPLLALIAIFADDLVMTRRWNFQIPVLSIVVLSVLLIPRLHSIFRRQIKLFPGRIQIRLSERGCVQYDALPAPSIFFEFFKTYSWLIPALVALGICGGFWFHQIVEAWVWICCPILLIAAFFLWFECRRIRRVIAKLGDGAIADRNAAFFSPTPWQRIRYYQLLPLKAQNYRLRIENDGGTFPVDAEIHCTAEQAEQLGQWMDHRLALERTKVRTPGKPGG